MKAHLIAGQTAACTKRDSKNQPGDRIFSSVYGIKVKKAGQSPPDYHNQNN